MRKLILFLLLSLLSNESYSQNGWVRQFAQNSFIRDVVFLTGDTGFLAGSNCILKTVNGGVTWVNTAPDTTISYNFISFLNQNTGYVSERQSSDLYSPIRIYKTTNAGAQWSLISTSQTSFGITGIQPINENVFYLSTGYTIYGPIGPPTHLGSLLKTTNGGESYSTSFYINEYHNFYSTQFINENTGWGIVMYDTSTTKMIKTTNGGQNWFLSDPGLRSISKYQFVNESTGYIIGFPASGGGVFIKTIDGGTKWQEYRTHDSINDGPRALYFIDANTGWLCGRNFSISKTTDGGNSWAYNRIYPPSYGNINFVKFNNDVTGWIKGDNSSQTVVYRTTNGGLSFVSQINSTIPENFSLYQNFPNPFNPSTIISYQLAINSDVQLKIYDALGNELQTLVNQKQNAGTYSVDFNAASLPSGIYFYKLVTEKFSVTKKMILVK
ncbi:MAG: T9SS type A sorting domain-containing protein [Bacteroidetes bacterium]|nr:T9SS type A sorting domain-containing protein [Bacteroidota bacterium]